MVRAPEPHHLEAECFLAEVVWCAEPDQQVDLPEGLDALARRDAIEQRRAGSQLVQPNPQQAQGVRIEDVEAAAPIHQHFGEPGVPDDQVENQWVLARIGDAIRVILAAEGDGVLRPVEEGGSRLLRGEDLVPLPLALAVGHVDGRPPEDEKTFSTAGYPPVSPSPPSFLDSTSFAAARL
jgi:hypothetical protein